jgi:hypothetical protein
MTWRRLFALVAFFSACALAAAGCASDTTPGAAGAEDGAGEGALFPMKVNGECGYIDQIGKVVWSSE